MEKISNKTYGYERALYNIKDTKLVNVSLKGNDEAESPLKECENIELDKCYFELRYPFWHDQKVSIKNTELTEKCRAALWYSNDITIEKSKLYGVKAIRECRDIIIKDSDIISPEFMWRSNNIEVSKTSIEGEYAFFESSNIKIKILTFKGKYSFQYVENLEINKSNFATKDAFWHAKNVVVRDSLITGEYLGWYSENVTFINCEIHSHQPLCYCKNLTLINCKMIDSDLAFEYSNVEADLVGRIESIKNPLSGHIKVDEIGELIREDDKYKSEAIVTIKGG